jgi:uncharacterized protein with HEPN domain
MTKTHGLSAVVEEKYRIQGQFRDEAPNIAWKAKAGYRDRGFHGIEG